jgi:CrcB protein
MFATLIAVPAGGTVGALGRYALSVWVQRALGAGLPWGTLAVNVVGCLLMGVLAGALQRGVVPPEFQALAAVGILGSFTTFSAFSLETVHLLQTGAWARALIYVSVSVVVGLGAVLVGMRMVGQAPSG